MLLEALPAWPLRVFAPAARLVAIALDGQRGVVVHGYGTCIATTCPPTAWSPSPSTGNVATHTPSQRMRRPCVPPPSSPSPPRRTDDCDVPTSAARSTWTTRNDDVAAREDHDAIEVSHAASLTRAGVGVKRTS